MATLRGTRLERTAIAFVFLSGLATSGRAADTAPERPRQVVEIRSGDLAFIVRDNSASPRVLSGIDSLYNVRDVPGFDAFDPHGTGASAGLNFEHIISGHRNPHNAFAPRSGPYRLFPTADGLGARLVRKGADDPWKVSSTLEYQAIDPNAIDFTFRCTCEKAELFGPRGYAIFFFANYMNDVADAALHFRGIAAPGGASNGSPPMRRKALQTGTPAARIAIATLRRLPTTKTSNSASTRGATTGRGTPSRFTSAARHAA